MILHDCTNSRNRSHYGNCFDINLLKESEFMEQCRALTPLQQATYTFHCIANRPSLGAVSKTVFSCIIYPVAFTVPRKVLWLYERARFPQQGHMCISILNISYSMTSVSIPAYFALNRRWSCMRKTMPRRFFFMLFARSP